MKNLRKALAVAAAAAALCTAIATPAQAGRGSFAYYVDGWWGGFQVTDPEDGRCYNTQAEAHGPANHTDRLAVLYRGTGCHEGAIVAFYESGQSGPDHFGSVKFLVR
ncbi:MULTISPECIES: hypothetical protein [Streptomyces]|uniref:hypothetical protein n=1 Tax=Streptomyces TaxID=1883 RepID=UPI001317AB5E|nr:MULTISPECIES: hypothetical protein [Streptomyces]QGZ47101.1 hypothetical protein GPZ77_00525 [Streptomyces sp. QHH-9511]GGU02238.1 hypothetical protein GCM10010272_54260 [Streptomyces lateritius]